MAEPGKPGVDVETVRLEPLEELPRANRPLGPNGPAFVMHDDGPHPGLDEGEGLRDRPAEGFDPHYWPRLPLSVVTA